MSFDHNHELSLTYEVCIYSNGKRFLHLGTGYSAVARFAEIAEAGVPEATEVKELWPNNYNVSFTGAGLVSFLERCYPEKNAEITRIDLQDEYLLDCYDMS